MAHDRPLFHESGAAGRRKRRSRRRSADRMRPGAKRRGDRHRREPHVDRSRPDRPRRNSGDPNGGQQSRQRTAGRLRSLCYAGALHHVRGGNLAGADPAAVLRRGRPQGRRGGFRRAVLRPAHLPSHPGGLSGNRRTRLRDAAARIFQGAAMAFRATIERGSTTSPGDESRLTSTRRPSKHVRRQRNPSTPSRWRRHPPRTRNVRR